MRYFAAWTIVIGVAGIFLSALASTASLRRWSVDPLDEGIVGLSLIAFLMSSVLSTLWFASGIIVGGPLTAMAELLWPDEALRDFDFGFISFLPINGAVGICIHFVLFPLLYWAVSIHPLPALVRFISVPLVTAALLLLAMIARHTTSKINEYPGLVLTFVGQVGLFWLVYLLILDRLAMRLQRGSTK